MKSITEAEIRKVEREKRVLAESYHKGLIDFTKWTSTLAVAGLLWVGNAIPRTIGPSRILAILSSGSLVVSLVFAILTVRRVLVAWANEWVVASEEHTLWLLKKFKALEPTEVTEEKEIRQVERLLSAIDATKGFSKPSAFNVPVMWHITSLVLGLLLYVLAQVLSML